MKEQEQDVKTLQDQIAELEAKKEELLQKEKEEEAEKNALESEAWCKRLTEGRAKSRRIAVARKEKMMRHRLGSGRRSLLRNLNSHKPK